MPENGQFPYNTAPREAMLRLVRESLPNLHFDDRYIEFSTPMFFPTPEEPGRTYISMVDTDYNLTYWFVYQRLDLAIALGENVVALVEGEITPAKIVENLNLRYNMSFTEEDVQYSHHKLGEDGEQLVYRVNANPNSLIWYGHVLVDVNYYGDPQFRRLLEDGQPRTLEDGMYRHLEDAA